MIPRPRLHEVLLEAARAAADHVMAVYGRDFAVEYKTPHDPVTEADKGANALLCAALQEAYPGIPLVAEESPVESFAHYVDADTAFFIDPLDGTREFVARNGEFCVMVGLAEQGRATAGIILCPALNLTVMGDITPSHGGAWSVGADGSRQPIRVSSEGSLAQSRLVYSRSHTPKHLLGKGQPSGSNPLGIREATAVGSSGVKALRVAMGAAEIYAHPGRGGMLWDLCAPEAIVVAAGGAVTDAAGQPFDYRDKELRSLRGVAMTNGRVHAELIERLRVLNDSPSAAKAP